MGHLETGRENAVRFVQYVAEQARAHRVIVIHADDRHHPWPWMKNPAWQNLVTDNLHLAAVEDERFINGDNIDGLLFTAISVAGDHRIERLSLNDSLDGPVPDHALRRVGARLQNVMPLKFWCGLAAVAVLATLVSMAVSARPVSALQVHSLEVPNATP